MIFECNLHIWSGMELQTYRDSNTVGSTILAWNLNSKNIHIFNNEIVTL